MKAIGVSIGECSGYIYEGRNHRTWPLKALRVLPWRLCSRMAHSSILRRLVPALGHLASALRRLQLWFRHRQDSNNNSTITGACPSKQRLVARSGAEKTTRECLVVGFEECFQDLWLPLRIRTTLERDMACREAFWLCVWTAVGMRKGERGRPPVMKF